MQLCTFDLADLFLAVPVEGVQEVIREGEMTQVPLAPDTVEGLMNLRGQIVTVIDLRRCLGLEHNPAGADMHVVLRREGNPVSLLVDEIGDVVEIDDRARAKPPRSIKGTLRELLAYVYTLEGRLLLVLDTSEITSRIARQVTQ